MWDKFYHPSEILRNVCSFVSKALQCGLGCCLLHSKETYVSSDVCNQAKITKITKNRPK